MYAACVQQTLSMCIKNLNDLMNCLQNMQTVHKQYRRRTIRMGQRHSGHPLSNAATSSAHAPQKRECPHGTSATAERGCSRQTSQVSVAAFSSSSTLATTVAKFGDSCRIWRLLPNSATNCRRFRRLVSSVDRA